MSTEIKLTRSDVGSTTVLSLVGLGTALVLVTYVTPVATTPQTVADLGAGPGGTAWMLSSMSLGLAAALLPSGALGDALGRRRVYLAGLLLMGLGALGCAVSPSTGLFVVARGVEGVGGAAVLACGLAVLAHAAADAHERGRSSAIWGASVGVGIAAGGVLAASLGGLGSGWRETYAVVGFACLALVLPSRRRLPESSPETPRRLDLPGLVLLVAAMVLLVGGLTEARSGFGAGVALLLVAAVVLLAGFAVTELRVRQPMVDPALGRSPAFLAATVGALALGGGMIGMVSNTPLLVQVVLGDSLWAATGLVVVWAVTSIATSLAVRTRPIPLPGPRLIGVGLSVVGLGQLLGLGMHAGSSTWRLVPAMVVSGLATGVLNAVLGRESVASVPPDRAAMGSGSNNTARYLGAACGITVFSVLMTHVGWDTAVWVAATVTFAGATVAVWLGSTSKSQS